MNWHLHSTTDSLLNQRPVSIYVKVGILSGNDSSVFNHRNSIFIQCIAVRCSTLQRNREIMDWYTHIYILIYWYTYIDILIYIYCYIDIHILIYCYTYMRTIFNNNILALPTLLYGSEIWPLIKRGKNYWHQSRWNFQNNRVHPFIPQKKQKNFGRVESRIFDKKIER
jgi:hypothetical protein